MATDIAFALGVLALLGIRLWLALLLSGVHATIAGVLLAMTVPASSFINPSEFLKRGRYVLDRFEQTGEKGDSVLGNEERQAALHALDHVTRKLEEPPLGARPRVHGVPSVRNHRTAIDQIHQAKSENAT